MLLRSRISPALSILILLAVAAMVVSCDSASTATLSIQSTTSDQAAPSASVSARSASAGSSAPISVSIPVINKLGLTEGSLEINKALIAVKEIEIEMEGQDDDESEYTGTFLVDLLNNSVTPEFPVITLPDGKYDEIEFEFDKLDGTETDSSGNPLVLDSDEMYQKSFYLAGVYNYNGQSTPFELAYALEGEVKMKNGDSINAFALTGHTDFVIAFRMDKWFDFSIEETNIFDVDFNNLNLSAPVTLNETINQDIMSIIIENIEESADYGVDEDNDGILEEDEDDD